MNLTADDPESVDRVTALAQGLGELGWTNGRNVQIVYRWAVGDPELFRRAGELVALAPDVIVAQGNNAVGSLLQATRTVPIVFANSNDPVSFRHELEAAPAGQYPPWRRKSVWRPQRD